MKAESINPYFKDCVKRGGFFERLLLKLSTSRRVRWNNYFRACKRIPKSSPVHGLTSWEKINNRRCWLITHRKNRSETEFRALQDVAGTVASASLVAQNFLLHRKLRRLKACRD